MPTEKQHSASHCTLQMRCYHSFEQVRPLRQSWDKLVERLDGDLFTSFDWCAVWWKHFGQDRQLELYIGTVGDELAAVVPLFRETVRWGPLVLRVVRIVGCDHLTTTCNITIQPEWLKPVVETVMAAIQRNGAWDIIQLGELPGYYGYAKPLADVLRDCPQAGSVTFSDNDYPHMVFDLPGTFDEFLASLSLKERRNVRRDERRLSRSGDVDYKTPSGPGDFEQMFTDLVKLHTAHWARRGQLGHFGDWPGIEAFHREIARLLLRTDRLVLTDVRADGRSLAMEYGGRFGRRVTWIIGGRRPDIGSRIGFCALLRSALTNKAAQIDALPGYYDYKRRLGARVLSIKNIRVLSNSGVSNLRVKLFKSVTCLVDVVYRRIWFWHLAPWLRRKLPKRRLQYLRAGLWPRLIHVRFLVATKPCHLDGSVPRQESSG